MKEVNEKFEQPTYLFHEDCPVGKLFDACDVEELLEQGWVDTPARLKLPENGDVETGLTKEDVKNACAEDIVKACEAMGFIVITQEQLKAEAVKMAEAAFNPENLSDDTVIEEFERRFSTSEDAEVIEHENVEEIQEEVAPEVAEQESLSEPEDLTLMDMFNENPESLSPEQLLILGEEQLGVSLRPNMRKDTMISRINDYLNKE